MMGRDEAYSILRDVIFSGFLTFRAEFEGNILIFKTLNNRELGLISRYSGRSESSKYPTLCAAYSLAYGLLAVNSADVFENKNIKDLFDFVCGLPGSLTLKLRGKLSHYMEKVSEARKYTEGFCYTYESRYQWKTLGNKFPNDPSYTGIRGTEYLGLNGYQESWASVNKMLDDEEDYSKRFHLSLMVASAFNPKGSKSLQSKFDGSSEENLKKREKLARDGFISESVEFDTDGWAASVGTREELVAELERQMTGVKDRHDHFMDQHFQRIKDKKKKREEELQKQREKAKDIWGDKKVIAGSTRVLTPEESEQLMSKSKSFTVDVQEEQVSSLDSERFLKKTSSRILTPERK